MELRRYRPQILAHVAPVGAILAFGTVLANAATVVALEASNTYGKGVARNDRRKGSSDRTADIQSRLSTRSIPVVPL